MARKEIDTIIIFTDTPFLTLRALLESVGLKNVQRFDRRELKIIPFYDSSMATIGEVEMSLSMEASK